LFGLKFDHRYFLLSYLVLLVAQMLWMPITARHIVRGPKKMPFAAIALDLTISSIAALALTLVRVPVHTPIICVSVHSVHPKTAFYSMSPVDYINAAQVSLL
jgi:hypothetical protein